MAGKKSDLGPTGVSVSHNVKRLREARRLGYAELSRQLAEIGREIPPLGLRRIESGQRRVDADDLVALAVALDASPIILLMPNSETGDESVALTGADGGVETRRLWHWLVAEYPLTGDTAEVVASFLFRSIPRWLIGDRFDVVEEGVGPNRTRIVRRYGGEQVLGEHGDGND
jgi:transcriptional regulator with XRE-family HTH domain